MGSKCSCSDMNEEEKKRCKAIIIQTDIARKTRLLSSLLRYSERILSAGDLAGGVSWAERIAWSSGRNVRVREQSLAEMQSLCEL